tara:strand:+ start:464 stop:832 length:369 start_codon:yes stop_codon:yes gene_type:complete
MSILARKNICLMRRLLLLPLLLSLAFSLEVTADDQSIKKLDDSDSLVNCNKLELLFSKSDADGFNTTFGQMDGFIPLEADRWYSKNELNKNMSDDFFDIMSMGLCLDEKSYEGMKKRMLGIE